jgi:hypothetical protein
MKMVEWPQCITCGSTDAFKCRLCGEFICQEHYRIYETLIDPLECDDAVGDICDHFEHTDTLTGSTWDVSGPVLSPDTLQV